MDTPPKGEDPRPGGRPLDYPEFRNIIGPQLDPNGIQPPNRVDALAKKLYGQAATGEKVEFDPGEKEMLARADAGLKDQIAEARERIAACRKAATVGTGKVDVPHFDPLRGNEISVMEETKKQLKAKPGSELGNVLDKLGRGEGLTPQDHEVLASAPELQPKRTTTKLDPSHPLHKKPQGFLEKLKSLFRL